ncbi:hypothetical protein RJ641_029745, partial [Dillenia turbinata]
MERFRWPGFAPKSLKHMSYWRSPSLGILEIIAFEGNGHQRGSTMAQALLHSQSSKKYQKKYHPDANKNNRVAKRKFQEIRNAYEEKVSRRDNTQYAAGNAKGFRYTYSSQSFDPFNDVFRTPFSDSFQKIFSEVSSRCLAVYAVSQFGILQLELSIFFSEAAKGCAKHLSFDAYVPCDSC